MTHDKLYVIRCVGVPEANIPPFYLGPACFGYRLEADAAAARKFSMPADAEAVIAANGGDRGGMVEVVEYRPGAGEGAK